MSAKTSACGWGTRVAAGRGKTLVVDTTNFNDTLPGLRFPPGDSLRRDRAGRSLPRRGRGGRAARWVDGLEHWFSRSGRASRGCGLLARCRYSDSGGLARCRYSEANGFDPSCGAGRRCCSVHGGQAEYLLTQADLSLGELATGAVGRGRRTFSETTDSESRGFDPRSGESSGLARGQRPRAPDQWIRTAGGVGL